MAGRDLAGLGDEAGLVECGEAEGGGDQEADEEFVVLGADAVGEDGEAEAEDGDDDQDLDVGGQGAEGAGGAAGEGCLGGVPSGAEAVADEVPAGVVRVVGFGFGALEGECEGAEEGREGGEGGDVAAGLEVDDAAEVDGDGDDRVPDGGEGGEGGEFDRAVGAGRGEPAQALHAVGGQAEEGGEGAADEGEDLEAAGVAVDGEVTGEGGGPGPGEEGGDDGEGAATGGEGAAEVCRDADEAGGRPGGGGARGLGCGGLCGHRCHALSATRSPSRPCGLNSSTRMRSTKAQTSAQDWLPNLSMPGMSAM